MLKSVKKVHYSVTEFDPKTLDSKKFIDVERTLDRAFIEQDDESDCSDFCLGDVQ